MDDFEETATDIIKKKELLILGTKTVCVVLTCANGFEAVGMYTFRRALEKELGEHFATQQAMDKVYTELHDEINRRQI